MSLKVKIPARLKALFAGVALSKKDVELITTQIGAAGLTDESTDEEIDAKLNERNTLYSFEDQKKYSDYLAGKAAKEVSDKETARLKALAEGKQDDVIIPENETPVEKMLRETLGAVKTLTQEVQSMKGEKVANTRRDQYAKLLEGTSETYKKEALEDFDLLNFKDDDHYSGWLERKAESVKDFVQEETNNGLGGDRPTGGAGGKPVGTVKEASAAEVDAAVDSII